MEMKVMFRSFCVFLTVTFCAAGCSTKESEKPKTLHQGSVVADKTTVLATIAAEEKPQTLSPPSGLGLHPSAATNFNFIFSERGGGVAYVVEKDGMSRVVHNGAAGKPYKTVGDVALSPDGKRIAYGALVEGKWRMVIDGAEGAQFSAVRLPGFSPNGAHLAYQGMAGEHWYLVVDTTKNKGTVKRFLTHDFSGDSSRITFIDDVDDANRGRLVVSDITFAKETTIGTGLHRMLLNADRSRVAAIETVNNKQKVITFNFDKPGSIARGKAYDEVQNLAFGPDGVPLAYTAVQGGKHVILLGEREFALPEGVMAGMPVVHPGKKTVGVLLQSAGGMFLEQFVPSGGSRESAYQAAENLVYSSDGRFYAYAATKGESWCVVVNGKEGPVFDRVVSPKFSPDGKFLVYRARKSGKRFVVVADTSGKTIKTFPEYEQVFDVQFTADGRSVAYGVKDDQKLIWKVDTL